MGNALSVVTSQKATAALGATIGLGFAGPLISRVPFVNTPIGAIVVGIGIAAVAAKMLDGHTQAFAIGVGIGLAARGLVALAFPQMVTA